MSEIFLKIIQLEREETRGVVIDETKAGHMMIVVELGDGHGGGVGGAFLILLCLSSGQSLRCI